MKKNKIFNRILIIFAFFLAIVTSISVFSYKTYADGENTVYFNQEYFEANDAGIVIAEIVGDGKPGDSVGIFFHTEGGTAIPGLDFVSVNTLVNVKYDTNGKLSYKVSIKSLNTADSREKLRLVDQDNNIYGRYFKVVIEKATGANVVAEKNSTKCYLPYSYKAEVVTGVIQDTATDYNEDHSYIKYYANPQFQFHKGKNDIDGKSTWYTWKNGMTFNNDTSNQWLTGFINQGLADAYGTFFMERCYDKSSNPWVQSDTNIFIHYGNKELIDTYDSDYNKDKDCPGLALYLETEPQDSVDESAWYNPVADWQPRSEKITPYAMKKIFVDRKNPYDDDDHEHEIYADVVDIKKETSRISWIQQESTWYAGSGTVVTTGGVKIDPYNGVLDTGLSVYNNNKEYDRSAENIYQVLSLVDNKTPNIIGEFVDDSDVSTTERLKIYLRFDEPVHIAKDYESFFVYFNDGSNYKTAEVVEGNYTDTLVLSVEAPKENIRKMTYEFPTNNVGDLAFNVDEYGIYRNNRLPEEITSKPRELTFLNGAVNLLKPTITIDQENSNNQANNIYNLLVSINDDGQKDLKKGKLYYTLDKTETWVDDNDQPLASGDLEDSSIYKNVHEFTEEENGSLTFTIVKNEAEGIDSGTYYFHLLAVSDYGLKDYKTYGGYILDGDPPSVNQIHPATNTLTKKTYTLELMKKTIAGASEINNIYLIYNYTDKDGKNQEARILFVRGNAIVPDYNNVVTMDTSAEDKIVYTFTSTIDKNDDEGLHDKVIKKIMADNAKERMNFKVTFYLEDNAGNNSTSNSIDVIYDTRNTFNTKFYISEKKNDAAGYTLINDINVSYPAYDKSTVGTGEDTKIIVISYAPDQTTNYVDAGGVFSIELNGREIQADGTQGDSRFEVTLKDLAPGFYDIVPRITGKNTSTGEDLNLIAQNIQFYITNNKTESSPNMEMLGTNLVLSNKVYQLQDQRYYYLDAGGADIISYPYGATYDEVAGKSEGGSTYPSFSNVNEAKKYIKYMEYQDLYLLKISASTASFLNSGQGTSYVKASGETVTAQEGQLWIRYKKNTWQNTATAYSWAYYYYGNGNVEDGINLSALSANLNSAINEVVNRIANEGLIVNLVEEENLNTKTGAPYLASTQIHSQAEEALESKTGIKFIAPAKYDGDKSIYQNTVKIGDNSYYLATNMEIKSTSSTRMYYLFNPVDDATVKEWKEIIIKDGMRLSEVLTSTGIYLIREYGDNGISEYKVYFDKTLPVVRVIIGNDEVVLDGETLNFSSDTFIIKGFTSTEKIPLEVDDLAYIALYSFPNKKLIEVLYASDFENGKDKKLEEKNYYIQVGDRSGNIATYTVLLSNSELRVEAYEDDNKTSVTVKVYDRSESEIYLYEVYCNEELVTTEFAETKIFREPGIYRINVKDIYGNEVTTTVEFEFKTPDITWYYTKDDTFIKYDPESLDDNKIVNMAIYDDEYSSRISNVYTSSILRLSFETDYGEDEVEFEVLDLASGDYTYTQATSTITLNKLAGFRFRVWFKSLPENDHTYVVKVDNEAPIVTASFIGTSYYYSSETDDAGNIISGSFDKIDFSKYAVGDEVTLDTLAYTKEDNVESTFENGAIISGGHIVLGFSDPSKIFGYTISRNGQSIEMALNQDQQLIINNYGVYEITVTDKLGNVRRFNFTNTNEPLSIATIDENSLADSTLTYGHDNMTLNVLYPGDNKILVKTPDGKRTFIINFDGAKITYGNYYYAIEQETDESGEIVKINTVEFKPNPDFLIDLEDLNLRENSWYTMVEDTYYKISIMIVEGNPIYKVEVLDGIINVESEYVVGNTVFPSYYKVCLSREEPSIRLLTGDDEVNIKEGSNYIYIADVLTIDSNVNPNIVSIEYGYSQYPNVENLKVIYQNGQFLETLEGTNEGFYRIVVKNIYNNQKEYIVAKIDSFTTIVEVTYIDGTTRTFLSDDKMIYSNSLITFRVYTESVSFELDGETITGYSDAGATVFELYKTGTHQVKVIGDNGVTQKFDVTISSDSNFVFEDSWVTGYNPNALLLNDGYTNLSLTPVVGKGVEYIGYKYGENEVKTLYDNISEEKIINENFLNLSIGNDGIGDYVIYFKNIYGDVVTKTIHFSNEPALKLSRKTVAESASFADYDLQKAIDYDFYSNYVLRFETSSIRYEFRIDDALISLDEPKVLEFSNSSGNGSFGYQISYLDEYGNFVEFRAELYRANINIDKSRMNEIYLGSSTYTKDNIVIEFEDDLTGTVRVDDNDPKEYKSGTIFYKDGMYEFVVEDIAGNRNTYVINHKSINHYTLTNEATDQPVIIGSVINEARVVFEASDDSKIANVFKNSEEVLDYSLNTFDSTGHWEIIIEDSIGNKSYAGFYIIDNPLISFEYKPPFDYEITEIWQTTTKGQKIKIDVPLDQTLNLTENGDYAVVVSSLASNTTFNFSVTIDNTPPQATLNGVDDGGVTARNVTISGLKSGDVVEIYKDGELMSRTDVTVANSTPEITTGGNYKVIIKSVSGSQIEYNFTRKQIANAATSVFIIIMCFASIAGVTIGLLYHTRLKNDSEK